MCLTASGSPCGLPWEHLGGPEALHWIVGVQWAFEARHWIVGVQWAFEAHHWIVGVQWAFEAHHWAIGVPVGL